MAPPRFPSAPVDPAPLGAPLELPFSGRKAPNRFLKAAMSERLASWHPTNEAARGIPSPEQVTLYTHWGAGGWGQIQTGNIMVHPGHLEAQGCLVIPREAPFEGERFERFSALAAGARKHGSLIIGQVSHAGRQVDESVQKHPISASDVQLVAPSMSRSYAKPRAATKGDIREIVDSFAHAAEFLDKAGFDGIELHGAHGYLLAQFLSRSTNKRTDEYGGSLENRARLILEIAEAVRARVSPSFIVGAKINIIELQEDGVQPADARDLCAMLEAARFDFVEFSGGNYEKLAWMHVSEEARARENFYIQAAEEVMKWQPVAGERKMKSYTTGGFQTVGAMVKALEVVDGVGIGRAACQEPRLPLDILSGKVTGIMKYAIGEDEMFKRLFTSGTQIRQISRNQEPVDLTVPENVEKMWGDIMAQLQRIGQDKTGATYGLPDVTQVTHPYAEPGAQINGA
ncbi:uncharacterized protein E0L32_006950 [Thyridium curvatum]|uniref:NADH:flavin oxidoreductase/NADH oxidase N-terminal domain-containing protein n=1 Tax=Thyridium curvatum TaxID=1093900 RepID=A0A507AXD3_9PEZI|nr:uncharacterized protein E0L32_006950 [Thyridium curvatum]TPX12303.1 hypothetical protein E0L32_006950 [Thyridium curvatum]